MMRETSWNLIPAEKIEKLKKKSPFLTPRGPSPNPHISAPRKKLKNRLGAVKSIAMRVIQPKFQVSTTTQRLCREGQFAIFGEPNFLLCPNL